MSARDESRSAALRCDSTNPLDRHMRCVGKSGHEGLHHLGGIAWSGEERVPFQTTREELFEKLCLGVPSGYIEMDGGKFGPGRTYYKTVSDLLDALRVFCDEKENRG